MTDKSCRINTSKIVNSPTPDVLFQSYIRDPYDDVNIYEGHDVVPRYVLIN